MALWIWIVTSWIVSATAVVGNAFVIYIIGTRKTLRTTANVFICSLAISDIGVGISSFVPGAYFLDYFVSSEGVLQETCDFLASIFYSASVLNLCLMTVNRYIAIALPYKYMSIMSRTCVVFLVTLSWFASVFISLVPLAWISNNDEQQRLQANSIFYPTISLLLVVSSYLILIPTTLHVYLIALKHYNRINAVNVQLRFNHGRQTSFRARDTSSSKVLMIAAVVFILCYSVQLSQEICDLFSTCSVNSYLTMLLLLLNSAINPFVYLFHKTDIRRELRILLKPCCCLKLLCTE